MAVESDEARVDRELEHMLQKLRVVLPGVQVLLAFLLTAPFQPRSRNCCPASAMSTSLRSAARSWRWRC